MIGMPKPKPDNIIRHEISFTRPVQDTFDTLVYGITANRIATPMVTLMNDVTGTATFLALVAALGFAGVAFTFIISDELSVAGLFDSFLTQREQAMVAAGVSAIPGPLGIGGNFFSNFFGLRDPQP